MNRVRYAENGNDNEVRYFIYTKGLNFGEYTQLVIKNKIEIALDPKIWYCEMTKH
jgi:hypothetical protein